MNDKISQKTDKYRHTEQTILCDVPIPRYAAYNISRGKREEKCKESEDEIDYLSALCRFLCLKEAPDCRRHYAEREEYFEEVGVIKRERSFLRITIAEIDTLEIVVSRRK